jgi:putative membrane protein
MMLGVGFIGLVLLWIVLGGLAILLVRYLFANSERNNGSSARDMLDERYARGDISREEYEQMRRDLRS